MFRKQILRGHGACARRHDARYDRVEPFLSRGEIDQGSEHRGVLVEEGLHPLQCSQYSVLEKSHLSSGTGCVTREMKAATVRVCAVAEWGDAVRRRHGHIAMRVLRASGGGRARSGRVISIVGME